MGEGGQEITNSKEKSREREGRQEKHPWGLIARHILFKIRWVVRLIVKFPIARGSKIKRK